VGGAASELVPPYRPGGSGTTTNGSAAETTDDVQPTDAGEADNAAESDQ